MQNATFAAGRRPPHAERRAKAITDRAGESLRQAEILVRAVADAMLENGTDDLHGFRARVGARWWTASWTAETLGRACAGVRDAADRWAALADGSQLRLAWRAPRHARVPAT